MTQHVASRILPGTTVSPLLWLAFIPPGEGLFVRLSRGKNSLTTHTLCQTDQSQQGTLRDSS